MATKTFKLFNKFSQRINYLRGTVKKWVHPNSGALSPDLELAFNSQVNTEFFASFNYLSMAVYFGKQNVSLPGCHKFFLDQVSDEREHAQKLIDYILRRGSAVQLYAIEPPPVQEWCSPLDAFQDALKLEKLVTKKLLDLRKTCEDSGDTCSCLLIENEFLDNQIEEMDKLSRYVTELEKIGSNGLGIYLFDKYILNESK